MLLMTPEAQLLFMRRVVGSYSGKAVKVKATMRPKLRLSNEECDKTATMLHSSPRC